jgi:heme/copper-type cytochrome/quinol oxidase subunit 4
MNRRRWAIVVAIAVAVIVVAAFVGSWWDGP